ncbi:MAG: helix-turn-helix domain-containing protein [Candidatus Taylorbacteria bacterium]
MSNKLLEQIGLTGEQARVYSCLVSSGTLQARKIASESMINRSLVYRILKQLIEFGLIIENSSPGSVSTFTALHPSKLHAIVKRKEDDLKIADQALHEAISSLGSQFNLTNGKPSVRFYEGLDGWKILHKDILHTKENIMLIRSPMDNNTNDLKLITGKNRAEMKAAGISIKLIVPIKNTPSSIDPKEDKHYLIERKRIPREDLNNPAQVVIYGNKVALTSFRNSMITTIIEDSDIATTFRMFFDVLWNKYPK